MRLLPPACLPLAVLLVPGGAAAQELLPSIDPPAAIRALAQHTCNDRKDRLNRSLELSYRTAGPAWKLVHACVRKDTGKIQALKVAYSKDVRSTRTEEKWKQYEVMIQAFFLHHAGEFRDYLRDDLLEVATIRENAVYSQLAEGVEHFDAASTTELLSGACAAALFPKDALPYTHACVHSSLDRFASLTLDPENDSHARVIAINAVLQCALVTGRLGEFKNERWQRVFDELRDLLPPNGVTPRVGAGASNDVFGDWGAALRIGAVLFNEPSYAYAANKFRAGLMRDPALADGSLSPAQWSFLNYEIIDKMAVAPAPVLSVVQRSYQQDDDTVQRLILRTGHHPRAAALLLAPNRSAPGASVPTHSPSIEFWAGGSLLTPRVAASRSIASGFAMTPPGNTVPPSAAADPNSPGWSGNHGMRCDSKLTAAANRGEDAQGMIVFPNYLSTTATLTRRFVLTREGILVILDRLEGKSALTGHSIGPTWPLGHAPLAQGENWFAFPTTEHFLPPGYDGTPRAAVVWFAPTPGGTIGLADLTAFQKLPVAEARHDFLTVVVPYAAEVDPRDVAAMIKADGLSQLTVGKVTVTVTDDHWSVTGNGPRHGGPNSSAEWRPSKRQELRTWTDRTGRQIEAELLGAADGKIEVRLANRKIVKIPFARLSDNDQEHLRLLRVP